MKESKFIEQNKENWLEFEKNLRYKKNKVSRLNRLFIQITDDLSYARTFYRNRSVKIYLNGIAQILFNDLYKNKSGNFKSFINFWKLDLPLKVHEARSEFKVSFIIFILAFTIGILSSIYDKDFASLILGKEYVQMTLENIKHHDPLAVYKKAHETTMFVGITINNLMVALSTFAFGVFFSIGTVLSLIHNAIVIGGFQYFFIEKGLFKESFLTIWQHGTLEISSIIIAGAAGLTLGKGLIFPGTFSRIDAFKISALRGLKIFTGIAPIIILAAFIEGFITRHTEISNYVRIMVIGLSLTFILFYFVWYPWYTSRKHQYEETKKEKVRYIKYNDFNFNKILSAEEILGYVISFTKKNILWLVSIIAGISLIHAIGTVIYEAHMGSYYTSVERHSYNTFFNITRNYFQFFLGTATLSFLQCLTGFKIRRFMQKALTNRIGISAYIKFIISSVFISAIVLLPFRFGIFWGLVSSVVVSPFLFMIVYYSFNEQISMFTAVYRLYEILDHSWKKIFWNSIKISSFLSIAYLMMNTQIIWQNVESIYINFNYSGEIMYLIQMFILTAIGASLFILFYFLQILCVIFTSYTFKETIFAESLKERIAMLGERNSLFGFEKE